MLLRSFTPYVQTQGTILSTATSDDNNNHVGNSFQPRQGACDDNLSLPGTFVMDGKVKTSNPQTLGCQTTEYPFTSVIGGKTTSTL